MSSSDSKAFLHDVLESISRIERFTAGKTYESYIADELLQSAVERQLSIIGEAIAKLNRVDPTLGDRLLDSPQIIAFRNRLIHNYGQVDHAIVWGVISSKISLLRDRASTLLAG